MLQDGIDLDKTFVTKRLVFNGQLSQKIQSWILVLLTFSFGLFICYKFYESHLNEISSLINTLYTCLLLICVIIITLIAFKRLSNRDKLKEITVSHHIENAKKDLIKAAYRLNWRSDVHTKHYVIFQTKYEFSKDSQSVTLIFFPDNRIYFNSLHYPNDYWYPARFMENYQSLMDEYLKLVKE